MASGSDGAQGAEARAHWAKSAHSLVGQVVGHKYRIESILGRGGMGTIYRAEQEPLGRKVALKVLHSNLGDAEADPEFQKRFLLEAATLSQLSHPNIVVVHDYGKLEHDAAACFMAMELLDGKTINQVLGEEGPFDAARALRITRDIARALRAAHDLGVIHRDLKPSNVMLVRGPEGESVKVLDFGLVKVLRDDTEELTAEGRFLGSPRYMSPEQIQRLPMDGRTDLYSLGVILYRMLSGEVPFAGDHAVQTLMAHLQEPVPRIEERTGIHVPPPVEAIVMTLLEKEPERRFPDASALIAAIDRLWPALSEEPLQRSAEMPLPHGLAGDRAPRSSPELPIVAPRDVPSEELSAPSGSGEALSAPPKRAGRGVPLLLAAIVVIGVGLGAGTAAWMMGAPPEETAVGPEVDPAPTPEIVTPTPTPTLTPTIVPSTPPEAPPAPRTFTLTVTSDPRGATVLRDGDELGETPLRVELDAAALEQEPARFVVRMRGRRPHVFTQGPSDVDVEHEAPLPRVASTRRDPETPRGGDMSIKTSR